MEPSRRDTEAARATDARQRTDEPLTEEFLSAVLAADDISHVANSSPNITRTYSEYVRQLLTEKGATRAEAIREAQLNSTYGWQVFEGARRPGRNTALRIAFALGMTLREANRSLAASGNTQLYCKVRRDAIIIFCLEHGYSLNRTDDALYRFGEETICPRD